MRQALTVSHGEMNDIKRHVDGAVHQPKYKDLQGSASISNLFGRSQEQRLIHTSRVTSAEVEMVNFITMHNLSLQAADHLSDLFPSCFLIQL